MNFELGKEYIVRVTEKGIIPIEEFDRVRFFDKDYDDLEFLTDEEKQIIIKSVINDVKAKIREKSVWYKGQTYDGLCIALKIIDKYIGKAERGE